MCDVQLTNTKDIIKTRCVYELQWIRQHPRSGVECRALWIRGRLQYTASVLRWEAGGIGRGRTGGLVKGLLRSNGHGRVPSLQHRLVGTYATGLHEGQQLVWNLC